jgi:hypothetical protein
MAQIVARRGHSEEDCGVVHVAGKRHPIVASEQLGIELSYTNEDGLVALEANASEAVQTNLGWYRKHK